MRELLHIVPALDPDFDGIGDYALQLADALRKLYWADSRFAVARRSIDSPGRIRDFRIDILGNDAGRLVLKDDGADHVVLHYVGYGYDPAGAPSALVKSLREWKSMRAGRQLFLMVHETWASGVPWRRTFWQQFSQKRCLSELLDLSDATITTVEANERMLRQLRPAQRLGVIPIGCNFDMPPPPAFDYASAVILGQEGPRLRAVRRHAELIRLLVGKGRLERVVLAGASGSPSTDASLEELRKNADGCEIETCFNFVHGTLPEGLLRSGLALMHSETNCLLKSTSFLAAAHLGQTVVTWREGVAGNGFVAGSHFVDYLPGGEEAVAFLLKDDAACLTLGTNCRERAGEVLSWEAIARRWSACAEALSAGKIE